MRPTRIKNRSFWLAIVLILLGAPSAGLGGGKSGITIVGTMSPYSSMVKCLLKNIPDVHVETLIPRENDPHSFALTPREISLLRKAAVIVGNGRAESLISPARLRAFGGKARAVLTYPSLASKYDKGGGLNPHTWLNPHLLREEAQITAVALIDSLPKMREKIMENLREFDSAIASATRKISELSSKSRNLGVITFHDGLDPLLEMCGIEVVGHAQKLHGVPPTPRDLFFLLKRGEKFEGKLVVVSETKGASRTMERIARSLKAPLVNISLVPPEFDDPDEFANWFIKIVEKITSPYKIN